MVRFLMDPTGDIPWEEDATAGDVVHIDTQQVSDTLVPWQTISLTLRTVYTLTLPNIIDFLAQKYPQHCSRVTPLEYSIVRN